MYLLHPVSDCQVPTVKETRGVRWGVLGSAATLLLDFVFPDSCWGCGSASVLLCPNCVKGYSAGWRQTTHPFLADLPVWSLGVYQDIRWGSLVRDLKFANMWRLGELVIANQRVTFSIPSGAVFVPIPQARTRFARRGYNQAELIAKVVARLVDGEVALLLKTGWRQPMTHFQNRQRRLKQGHKYSLAPWARRYISRPIVLVDDVMTTGATIAATAKMLRDRGWVVVGVVVLAVTVSVGR